ncbi:hypothetical protein CMV_007814 [Castanea mollissima]|uniref:Uncharacterized protein n=1 Tax=Castanea mollissima TaxID=60419 RepID=A0A8J4RMM2_9ROSI|nr:hypothetical protein CMV_007814 [Castanea mollissima]
MNKTKYKTQNKSNKSTRSSPPLERRRETTIRFPSPEVFAAWVWLESTPGLLGTCSSPPLERRWTETTRPIRFPSTDSTPDPICIIASFFFVVYLWLLISGFCFGVLISGFCFGVLITGLKINYDVLETLFTNNPPSDSNKKAKASNDDGDGDATGQSDGEKEHDGDITDNYDEPGQGYEDIEQEDDTGIYSNGLHYKYDNGDNKY